MAIPRPTSVCLSFWRQITIALQMDLFLGFQCKTSFSMRCSLFTLHLATWETYSERRTDLCVTVFDCYCRRSADRSYCFVFYTQISFFIAEVHLRQYSVPMCVIVYKAFLTQLASCSKQPNYWVKPWLSLPRVLRCIPHPSQAPESFLSALHQCHLHLPLQPGLGCLPTAI